MKKILLIILSIAMITVGCETIDFGDTDKNVNGPSDPNTASLLQGAQTNFATRRGRPYRITPTLYVQYFMQHVYNDEMLYAETAGFWQSYYVQTASNCQLVINLLEDPENADNLTFLSNGPFVNQIAVAKIFKSVIFKRITDLFGDVPYSEFYNPEIISPKYDTQASIYAGMIAEVKEARDMIDPALGGIEGDMVFGGNMGSWQKFANSFLMTLAMQMSDVNATVAETEFVSALNHPAGVIETASEEARYTFDVTNGYNNPWEWMRPADYGMTRELLASMKGDATYAVTSNTTWDDRVYFVTDDVTAEGHPYGYAENTLGVNAPVNSNQIDPGTQLPLLTAAYIWLLRAEAADKGWTAEDADVTLENGILASYDSFNSIYTNTLKIDPDPLLFGTDSTFDGTVYAAARVADAGVFGHTQVIAEEKLVALFPCGYDAWFEWRRTGWPDLSPAPDALNDGNIPRRYNYPSEEPNINASNYATGVSGLAPASDVNTSRTWWDDGTQN